MNTNNEFKIEKLEQLNSELKQKVLNMLIQCSSLQIQDLFNRNNALLDLTDKKEAYWHEVTGEINLSTEEYHKIFNALCVSGNSVEEDFSNFYIEPYDNGVYHCNPLRIPSLFSFLKIHYFFISQYIRKERADENIEPLDITEDEFYFILCCCFQYVSGKSLLFHLAENNLDFIINRERSISRLTIFRHTIKFVCISEEYFLSHHSILSPFFNILSRKNKHLKTSEAIRLFNDATDARTKIGETKQSILEKNKNSQQLTGKHYSFKDMTAYPDAFYYNSYIYKETYYNTPLTNTNLAPFQSYLINNRLINAEWLKQIEGVKDVKGIRDSMYTQVKYPSEICYFIPQEWNRDDPDLMTTVIICQGEMTNDLDLKFWDDYYEKTLGKYFLHMIDWVESFCKFDYHPGRMASDNEEFSSKEQRIITAFYANNIYFEYKDTRLSDTEKIIGFDTLLVDFLKKGRNNFPETLYSPVNMPYDRLEYKDGVACFSELRVLLNLSYFAQDPLERHLLIDERAKDPTVFSTILLCNEITRKAIRYVQNNGGRGQGSFSDPATFMRYGYAAVICYLLTGFKQDDLCTSDGRFNTELYQKKIDEFSSIFERLKSRELFPATKKFFTSDYLLTFIESREKRLVEFDISDWESLIEEVSSMKASMNV